MDHNRDEVRRQLKACRQDHAEAMPRYREALKQLFDPKSAASAELKAGALGLPSRRSFLTVGGAAVAGSALLAACGQTPKNQIAQTGTTPPQPSSTTTTAPGSPEMDVSLLRTASSIEILAINTYETFLTSAALSGASAADTKSAIELFRSQHQQHLGLLSTVTTDAGGEPYTEANLYLNYEVVAPTLLSVKTAADVQALATTLEDTAAQTYVYAGGVLTTQNLRMALMSIGATEARHLTTLYLLQQQQPVPLSIFSTAKAAPPDSLIGPKGPVKPKDLLPTPTTAASG
jgi:rubrerythrin